MLRQKDKQDQTSLMNLQSILVDRQMEYSGLQKHYTLVEQAIKGTSYVAEIQERITKISSDDEYKSSVSADLDLVK